MWSLEREREREREREGGRGRSDAFRLYTSALGHAQRVDSWGPGFGGERGRSRLDLALPLLLQIVTTYQTLGHDFGDAFPEDRRGKNKKKKKELLVGEDEEEEEEPPAPVRLTSSKRRSLFPLAAIDFWRVVLDESHYAKSLTTSQASPRLSPRGSWGEIVFPYFFDFKK